ncbi:polynucleotide kinase [Acidianus tailed spindle virus]|uniref:polynucleotide kinase n=1 Tax=Acidianus tailed spindle virus TaxID=1797140 RepID=UPI00076F2B07|nr:polynucleotide kinase [Acidianus tailed spindle virus]AME30103.1 phosphatase [Acidianus tailed spindle virus]
MMLILDLDGTLFDTSARWNECEKISNKNKRLFWAPDRVFWECYQSPRFMNLDEPKWEVIRFVKRLIEEKKPEVIAVVSGRSEKQREATLKQLSEIGIEPNEVVLRGEKDFRKDYEFKKFAIKELMEKYDQDKVIVIDDSDAVLEHLEEEGLIEIIDAKTIKKREKKENMNTP